MRRAGEKMKKRSGRNYSVYKHTNTENGKVYIGITCQKPERRWQNGAGYTGTVFGNAIKKYGWDGFSHEVIASGLTEKEACAMEIALIAAYKSNIRGIGYNVSGGGNVVDCINPKVGKDNNKAVAVIRIDPETGERKRFECVADAVRAMGINHRGISKACRGIANTYMGYIWEYAEIPFDKPKRCTRGNYPHTKQKKRVRMTDTDGTVYLYHSIGDAAKAIGVKTGTTVSRYLLGLRHDATGRKWEYV